MILVSKIMLEAKDPPTHHAAVRIVISAAFLKISDPSKSPDPAHATESAIIHKISYFDFPLRRSTSSVSVSSRILSIILLSEN
jgi:hypothetical protein